MVSLHSPRDLARQRRPATWVVSGLVTLIVLAVVTAVAVTVAGDQQKGPFAWLVPTSAPTNWDHVVTPAGTAVLSYPPSFRPVHGDPLSVSVAVGRGPRYIAYLNVTPQQGNERLQDFAAFRVNLLGDDDAKRVHEDGMAQGLRFRGGQGSAVLDDYVTRVGNNHYKEIAAFVVGRHGGWVIVGAALDTDYAAFPNAPPTGGELILTIVKRQRRAGETSSSNCVATRTSHRRRRRKRKMWRRSRSDAPPHTPSSIRLSRACCRHGILTGHTAQTR